MKTGRQGTSVCCSLRAPIHHSSARSASSETRIGFLGLYRLLLPLGPAPSDDRAWPTGYRDARYFGDLGGGCLLLRVQLPAPAEHGPLKPLTVRL